MTLERQLKKRSSILISLRILLILIKSENGFQRQQGTSCWRANVDVDVDIDRCTSRHRSISLARVASCRQYRREVLRGKSNGAADDLIRHMHECIQAIAGFLNVCFLCTTVVHQSMVGPSPLGKQRPLGDSIMDPSSAVQPFLKASKKFLQSTFKGLNLKVPWK